MKITKPFDTVLFDFDGTLAHSDDGLFATINHTLRHFGHTAITVQQAHTLTGKSLADFFMKFETSEEKLKTMSEFFHRIQFEYFHLYTLFPEVLETLRTLRDRGYKMGLVTTANRLKVDHLIRELAMGEIFHCVITAEDVTNKKPHPEPFLRAMHKLSTTANTTLMVGDSEPDIQGAHNSGIKSVRVLYSTIGEKILDYKPTYTIKRFHELLTLVSSHTAE